MAKNRKLWKRGGRARAKIRTCRKCGWRYVLVGGAVHECPDTPYVDRTLREDTLKGWKKGRK